MKRTYYLDILKSLAIICVVSVHFIYIQNFVYSETMSITTVINRYFFSFNCIGVPLFFMVNGALVLNSEKNDYKKILKKAIKFWLQMMVWKFLTVIPICWAYSLDINIKDLIMTVFFDRVYPNLELNHFWFIITLISIYFIVPMLKSIYKSSEHNYIYWFMLLIFVLIFLPNDAIAFSKIFTNSISGNPLSYLNVFTGMIAPMTFYFLMGGLLHKNKEKIKIKSIWLFLITFFGSLVLLLEWYLLSKSSNINLDNVWWSYSAMSGILISVPIFILFSRLNTNFIEKNRKIESFITTIGSNTLGVYYLHWIFGFTFLNKFWYEHINLYGIIPNLLKAVIVTILLSYITKFLKKIPIIRKLF